MRIVCISDTHNNQIPVPDGDMLIHAGDLTTLGTPEEIRRAGQWLRSLPHAKKIVVAGNHDWGFEQTPLIAKAILREDNSNLIYLQDEYVEVNGLKIYGSPWQPEFQGWAFNLPRDGEELQRRWNQIPEGLDILITHGPVYGILDTVTFGYGTQIVRAEHQGDRLLGIRVVQTRPKLHICGHIHHGHGVAKKLDTLHVNAAICNDLNIPMYGPIILEN